MKTRLTHTLKGGVAKQAVFIDIDDTLFLSGNKNGIHYTGYSVDRWRAFLDLLSIDSLLGIVTAKKRVLKNTSHEYNGLPALPQTELNINYDVLSRRLFGYDGVNDSLAEYFMPELIYFTSQGAYGTKGAALSHAHKYHLSEDLKKENIFLLDDDPSGVNQESVLEQRYQFIKVPPLVYQAASKIVLEKACIARMLHTLKTLDIDIKETPLIYARITHRNYPDQAKIKKLAIVNTQASFFHKEERVRGPIIKLKKRHPR